MTCTNESKNKGGRPKKAFSEKIACHLNFGLYFEDARRMERIREKTRLSKADIFREALKKYEKDLDTQEFLDAEKLGQ